MNNASQATAGSTVADLILTAIARYPDRSAFANDEATISYRQLGERISRIAQHFDSLGLQPGDTVAQLGVNRFEVFAIAAAVYLRGLRSVTLHALGSEADHEFILNDCGARIVVVDEYHRARGEALRPRCAQVGVWLSLGHIPGFADLEPALAAYRPRPLQDDQGREVPDGERGEICVRGPLLMSGYLNREAETATALAGGWLHTGDIAYKDADGLYYIVDRKKDLIISGDFNVYPKEIEDTICTHAAVASAAVIGVPDEKWGELVMAYVQLKPGGVATEAAIAALVREAKGAVAAPKRVEFIPALPLTALGKIDKKALRARHWAAGERAVH